MVGGKSLKYTEHRDLFDLKRAKCAPPITAEYDSNLANDYGLVEMDSQPIADAKEFVPVSPRHATTGPLFDNDKLHIPIDLPNDKVEFGASQNDGNELPDYVACPVENCPEQEQQQGHEQVHEYSQQQQQQQQPLNWTKHDGSKPHSNEQSTNFVQTLVVEIMPILNEAEQPRGSENQKMEFDQANLSAGERIAVSFGLQLAIVPYNVLHQYNIWIFSDVENDFTLSLSTNEFVPSFSSVEAGFEPMHTSFN